MILYNFFQRYKFLSVYLPLIIYWLILFVATTLPTQHMPKTGISDKIEHFLGYFLLTFLLCNTLYFQDKKVAMKKFPVILALGIVAFYGMVDELHQYFVPGRFCDINDWIADVIGALIAGVFYFFLKMYFQQLLKTRNISLTN